jgi:hypothetical protein
MASVIFPLLLDPNNPSAANIPSLLRKIKLCGGSGLTPLEFLRFGATERGLLSMK